MLKKLTFVDRSGRVPYIVKEHSEEMGTELDEEAMYEPLVELVRGRGVGRLLIESNYANLPRVVDFTREENGIDPPTLKRALDTHGPHAGSTNT